MATLLRPREVFRLRGRPRSGHDLDVKAGLCTPAIKIGPRAIAWPDYEIAELNAARIAGRSDDEIRALVKRLVAARKAAA